MRAPNPPAGSSAPSEHDLLDLAASLGSADLHLRRLPMHSRAPLPLAASLSPTALPPPSLVLPPTHMPFYDYTQGHAPSPPLPDLDLAYSATESYPRLQQNQYASFPDQDPSHSERNYPATARHRRSLSQTHYKPRYSPLLSPSPDLQPTGPPSTSPPGQHLQLPQSATSPPLLPSIHAAYASWPHSPGPEAGSSISMHQHGTFSTTASTAAVTTATTATMVPRMSMSVPISMSVPVSMPMFVGHTGTTRIATTFQHPYHQALNPLFPAHSTSYPASPPSSSTASPLLATTSGDIWASTPWTASSMSQYNTQGYEYAFTSSTPPTLSPPLSQPQSISSSNVVGPSTADLETQVTRAALMTNNFYSRSLHTPFYQSWVDGSQLDYGSHGLSTHSAVNPIRFLGSVSSVPAPPPPTTKVALRPVISASTAYKPLEPESSSSTRSQSSSSRGWHNVILGGGSDERPEGFSLGTMARVDVRAYTFRKKARHYVAVKPQSALRIEPIIYLKTSILNEFEEALQNWDYLRLPLHRFRDQAIPKKKLNAEEMRTARILDMDVTLLSPNNAYQRIDDACPACVMRMGWERRILHVLPKNFKLTPSGEPVIDIRRGHVIICIKLSCYSDHHAEPGGFVIRMQANPPAEQQLQPHRQSLAELESGRTNPAAAVQAGDSVQIRICCEARTKSSLSGTGTASSADGPSQKKKRVRRKNLKASAEAISQQIQVKDPGPSTVKSDQSPYGGDQDEYEQEEGDDEGGRSSRASKRTGTGSVRRGSATRPGSRMTNGDDDDEGGEEEEEEEEGDEEEETVVDIDAVIVPTQRYPFSQPSAQVYYPPRP